MEEKKTTTILKNQNVHDDHVMVGNHFIASQWHHEQAPFHKDLHILIIDSQPSARKHLASILSSFKPKVVEAADGLEASQILKQNHNFDLVITDIEMPQMNGYQLCQNLKDQASTKYIPLIMVSSFESDHAIEKGFAAGANAYVSKNNANNCLPKIVARVLAKSVSLQGKKILVVEDSSIIRRILISNLNNQGYQVCLARDGQQAWQKLISTEENYDLILSDIKMPTMNGLRFCAKVKENSRFADIPFVVMSASEERHYYAKQLSQQDIAGYIVKPFEHNELIILLERIFSEQYKLLQKEREKLAIERNLMLSSITSLAKTIEARDPYTMGHSDSVANIICGMATVAGMTSEEIQMLHVSGRLHDIGKIGVSDQILLKPGPLTKDEEIPIKRHPVVGADIIPPIPSLEKIMCVILHHHERYDGKGYPDGLKGEEIPHWARMTAVADTYDAMTSNRPYRPKMSPQKALAIIKEVRGSQLCPSCVDLFLKWIGQVNHNGKKDGLDSLRTRKEIKS